MTDNSPTVNLAAELKASLRKVHPPEPEPEAAPVPCRIEDIKAPDEVTEHGILMSGGGFQVRNAAPEIEAIFPLVKWIPGNRLHGGHVYRRRIVVLEDWHEVDDQGNPL